MKTIEKPMIKKLDTPVDGYNYNVQIWKSLDGVNFCYCGYGKYFRTLSEAEAYKKEIAERTLSAFCGTYENDCTACPVKDICNEYTHAE